MKFVERIRKLLGFTPSQNFVHPRQREEGSDEILIFVIDESYSRIDEFVNCDDYPDEWSATEAASAIFLDQLKEEFKADFEEVNTGSGADLPAFVTVVTSNIIPLSLMALFFSGKRIVDNIEAWGTIFGKIKPFFTRNIILNRNGAAVLAVEAVLDDMDGIPKNLTLHGYRAAFLHDHVQEAIPTEVTDPAPTLSLSLVKHVFNIEADGVAYLVIVDGKSVAAKRI